VNAAVSMVLSSHINSVQSIFEKRTVLLSLQCDHLTMLNASSVACCYSWTMVCFNSKFNL